VAKSKKKPRVNPQLEGFELKVDSFGELKSTMDIDKINEFLNRNVDDKKLTKKKMKSKKKGRSK
jgi:hypothetical protein